MHDYSEVVVCNGLTSRKVCLGLSLNDALLLCMFTECKTKGEFIGFMEKYLQYI